MRLGISADASRMALAAIFVVAGVLHFAITETYVRVMPPYLPWPRELVMVSGVCQLAGGVGLCVPRLRRAAGWGLVLLLVAVWPANLQMYAYARVPMDRRGGRCCCCCDCRCSWCSSGGCGRRRGWVGAEPLRQCGKLRILFTQIPSAHHRPPFP